MGKGEGERYKPVDGQILFRVRVGQHHEEHEDQVVDPEPAEESGAGPGNTWPIG